MSSIRVTAMSLLLTATVAAQYGYHFEFDEAAVLPDATPGVAAGNPTGFPLQQFFHVTCGVLQQRTTVFPYSGAFFYSGSLPGYPTTGPGLDPNLPTFVEARFRQVGGHGGPGTVFNSTAVLGILSGAVVNMVVNVVTGDVGISTAAGIVWTTPTGGTSVAHTYRLESTKIGGSTFCQLSIDGAVAIGWRPAAPAPGVTAWYFGDGAGSNFIAADLDWEYVSIAQTPAGRGQANRFEASLFVNRDNATIAGMPGLAGPFAAVTPSGSVITLEWNGPPGAAFALFAGTPSPAWASFGCGGSADLFPSTLLFDPTSPFGGLLFRLDACGYAKQTLTVPSLPPSIPLIDLQGVILPFGGCPFVLTAAHYLTT